MAKKTIAKESEKSEQTVSDEALAQAEKAIRLYSELAEIITGELVEYSGQCGGPEAYMFFNIGAKSMRSNSFSTSGQRKETVDKFLQGTKYIVAQIETLMQIAMIEETRSGDYSGFDTLDLIKGCHLYIDTNYAHDMCFVE